MRLRSLLFWDVTQRWLVVRRFGAVYWSHLHGSSSPHRHLHPIDCLQTSLGNTNQRFVTCQMSEDLIYTATKVWTHARVWGYTNVHKCAKSVAATSTFQGPEVWRTEYRQILRASLQNLVARPTWRPGFMQTWCYLCYKYLVLSWQLSGPYVYWTVHHCDSWRIKDQLDVTCYFISFLMCSTYFGH